MEKVILLKTQLAEASRLAKTKTIAHDRLAVILLDNFVEIQLSALMKEKFIFDNPYYNPKKYSVTQRKKILNNYGDLLRTCVAEQIIDSDEMRILTFCHSVRNNLYHKVDEERLLAKIALNILYDIITRYQVKWKSASLITSWSSDTHDPYSQGGKYSFSGNSDEDWTYFLSKHFNFINKKYKKPSKLLSDFLLNKIREAKESYKFIKYEYGDFFSGIKEPTFDDFLCEYSFRSKMKDEIDIIKENVDTQKAQRNYSELRNVYFSNWSYKREEQLTRLRVKITLMASLPIAASIEKYNSIKDEVFMMHDALGCAASDLDSRIQLAIDTALEK